MSGVGQHVTSLGLGGSDEDALRVTQWCHRFEAKESMGWRVRPEERTEAIRAVAEMFAWPGSSSGRTPEGNLLPDFFSDEVLVKKYLPDGWVVPLYGSSPGGCTVSVDKFVSVSGVDPVRAHGFACMKAIGPGGEKARAARALICAIAKTLIVAHAIQWAGGDRRNA